MWECRDERLCPRVIVPYCMGFAIMFLYQSRRIGLGTNRLDDGWWQIFARHLDSLSCRDGRNRTYYAVMSICGWRENWTWTNLFLINCLWPMLMHFYGNWIIKYVIVQPEMVVIFLTYITFNASIDFAM